MRGREKERAGEKEKGGRGQSERDAKREREREREGEREREREHEHARAHARERENLNVLLRHKVAANTKPQRFFNRCLLMAGRSLSCCYGTEHTGMLYALRSALSLN